MTSKGTKRPHLHPPSQLLSQGRSAPSLQQCCQRCHHYPQTSLEQSLLCLMLLPGVHRTTPVRTILYCNYDTANQHYTHTNRVGKSQGSTATATHKSTSARAAIVVDTTRRLKHSTAIVQGLPDNSISRTRQYSQAEHAQYSVTKEHTRCRPLLVGLSAGCPRCSCRIYWYSFKPQNKHTRAPMQHHSSLSSTPALHKALHMTAPLPRVQSPRHTTHALSVPLL